MEQKEKYILYWKSGNYTIKEFFAMFFISRPTAYKYINRYGNYGWPGVSNGAKLQEITGIKLHVSP